MSEQLYEWAVLSVSTWAVSTTCARARVFRPLRQWVARRSAYFGEGISCQFCISHYVAVAMVAASQVRIIITTSVWVDWTLTWAATVGLSALLARTLGKTPPEGIHPDCIELIRKEGHIA